MAKLLAFSFIFSNMTFAPFQYPSEIVENENAPVPSYPKWENGIPECLSSGVNSHIITSVVFIFNYGL